MHGGYPAPALSRTAGLALESVSRLILNKAAMTKNAVLKACLAAVLSAQALAAAAAPRPGDPIPVAPDVTVGKLANGLTYYIKENSLPSRRLELRLVVKAGSVLEDDDQQGLAHFVEHMAFNGSTHFKRNELAAWLESIGVKMGADLNASTSFDQTIYKLQIPVANRANIDKGLQVLEDWAHGLTLNTADIDKERSIVLEELRLHKGAGDRMGKVTLPKIYNGSRYAQRLAIGKEEILRSCDPEALRRFYHDWYRPDLMAVIAVGDVDPVRVRRLIEEHFGQLANPAGERPRTYPEIPSRQVDEAVVVTDKEAGANTLLIRYPVQPTPPAGTYGAWRDKLVRSLFQSMLGLRLRELAQQAEPPFLGGGSGFSKLNPRYESYTLSAALGPRGPAPAIAALVQETGRARQYGFTSGELERVKKTMLHGAEHAYNERAKTESASYVAEFLRNFLEGEPMPGIQAEHAMMQELLPGITLEEVNAYAKNAIPGDAAKLVLYSGIERAGEAPPDGKALLAAVTAAGKEQLKAREDKAAAVALMDTPPQPGAIVEESEDRALGITRMTLSNGVKVILKPTDFKNDQVLMGAVRLGGQNLFEDKDIVNARLASAIVESMGIKNLAPLDLGKALAGKSASVHALLGSFTDALSGSAGAADIETMLQLAWLRFDGVRRDDALYKSFIGRQAEAARNRRGQPATVFLDTGLSALFNEHPRTPRALRAEDYAQASLDRSIDIYRQRFSSAAGMTFMFVGSFDVKAIRPLLATYLASLPAAAIPVALRDTGLRPVRGVVKRELHLGAEDKSTISLQFTGAAPYSAQERLKLQALTEVMNNRLFEVLRRDLGLIYGGRVNSSLSALPYGNYSVAAVIPTGPDSVDKVLAGTFAEIDKLKREGPAPEELAKIKLNLAQRLRGSLRQNSFWLAALEQALVEGSDVRDILQADRRVAALTAADIQEAARRYLDTDNYVQVVLYPEKPAAGKTMTAAADSGKKLN
jgi:zinc protease